MKLKINALVKITRKKATHLQGDCKLVEPLKKCTSLGKTNSVTITSSQTVDMNKRNW